MISRTGRLYLIDFGIARRYRQGQGKDTGALGSPGYAAPEQYGKKAQTTPQTDVYGLGATLQALLTGKEPVNVLIEGIPPSRSIPQNLQTLLARMLERDASKRPHDMDEVKQELQRLKDRLAGQRMKRIGAFAWWLLKSAFRDTLLWLCVPLFLSLIFSFTAFFTSPFWLPYVFIALGIIVGCTAWGLHQAMKSDSTRLNREERLGIVGKYLRNSVLLAALLGMLFSFYYGSQQTTTDAFLRSEELSALGLAALACIIGGLTFIGVWLGRGIRWLRSRGTSQHQTSRRAQSVPLQQQTRWRP
jgi:Protein kinase domain